MLLLLLAMSSLACHQASKKYRSHPVARGYKLPILSPILPPHSLFPSSFLASHSSSFPSPPLLLCSPLPSNVSVSPIPTSLPNSIQTIKIPISHLFRMSALVISLSSLSTARCMLHVARTDDMARRAEIAEPADIPRGASRSLQFANKS